MKAMTHDEFFNHLQTLDRREVEFIYEKTFGNPIQTYIYMDKSQMIEEIVDEHERTQEEWQD